MIRHAWLQKHPSPSAQDGEFHWHPVGDDRELRARLVEHARGIEAPAVVWELAPGRVAWGQVFGAIAPRDQRRYAGLVLTIVERANATGAELLSALALPTATPWTKDVHARAVEALDAYPVGDLAWLARSLLSDEHRITLGAEYFDALPAAVAALEQLVPASIQARTRRGVWSATSSAARDPDRVAMLVARACLAPRSRAAQGWRLLCELAAASARTVDEVAAQAVDTSDLATTLHAWGRGRSAGNAEPLADALALRVLASLIADRDPAPCIAAARWHALLPAERRALLFETCARRFPSLRAIAGGIHA